MPTMTTHKVGMTGLFPVILWEPQSLEWYLTWQRWRFTNKDPSARKHLRISEWASVKQLLANSQCVVLRNEKKLCCVCWLKTDIWCILNGIWTCLTLMCASSYDLLLMMWLLQSNTRVKWMPDSARLHVTSLSALFWWNRWWQHVITICLLGLPGQKRVDFFLSFRMRQTGWMETQHITMSHNHAADFTARLCIPGPTKESCTQQSTHIDTLSEHCLQ